MKNTLPIHLRAAAFVLGGVLASSVAQAKHYNVYLIGGQSNASGRGDAALLSAPYDSPQTDVAFYWHKTLVTDNGNLPQDVWLDLQPDSGQGKNSPSGHEVEFGPELAFGRTMADADPEADIAVIKYAHGGSNLHTQWADGGDMYATFVNTVEEALVALTASGHTFQVVGMLWQQGEADTGAANADNYEANLTDLIARVRTDLFGGLSLPFVIGGLSSNQYSTITDTTTGAGKVRLAQESVAANVDGCGFADADDCAVYDAPNVIHFNAAGQLALGAAHAAVMLQLEALDADLDGLNADQETALGTDAANPDSDGDGQKDGFEYRAGTDPADAASLFEVTGIHVVSNEVSLTWPSRTGNAYRVEYSSNLADWEDAEDGVPAAAPGTQTVWSITMEDDAASGPSSVLALYDAASGLNGDFNTTAFDSADQNAATTATRLQQGGSLTGGGSSKFVLSHALFATGASGAPGFNLAGTATANRSEAAAAGDTFAFTIEAGGHTVDYEMLSFYSDQYGVGGQLDVSYLIGTNETFVLQNYSLPGNNVSVELKEVDFADFSSADDVTWTFYLYGASAGNYGNRFDDITLYGSAEASAAEEDESYSGYYRVNLK